jgi:hypothetical protein
MAFKWHKKVKPFDWRQGQAVASFGGNYKLLLLCGRKRPWSLTGEHSQAIALIGGKDLWHLI